MYQYSFYLFQASWRPSSTSQSSKDSWRPSTAIILCLFKVMLCPFYYDRVINHHLGHIFVVFFNHRISKFECFSGWKSLCFPVVLPSECFCGGKSVECFKRLGSDEFEQWKKMEVFFFVGCRLGYGMRYCPIWSLGYTISHETKGPVMKQPVGECNKIPLPVYFFLDFLKWNSLNV